MQPPVVHGTAVDTSGGAQWDENFTKGEVQPKQCRDPIFALLGVTNFVAVITVALIYGPETFGDISVGTANDSKYGGVFIVLGATGGASIIVSGLMYLLMMAIPTFLIKLSLTFTIVISGILAVVLFMIGSIIGGIFNIIFFAIGICYARAVWHRIPFASANLKTGCTAIKQNCGSIIVSFIFVAFAFAFSFVWGVAFFSVYQKSCDVDADGKRVCQANYGTYFGMVFTYYFAHQIIQNTLHVTIAGVVGSWWFEPERNGCCGSGVCGGVTRACTTSFGSICFGSLIVAFIQALRALVNEARSNNDINPIVACIVECLLACLEGIIEYFNKWAYIYVGLYGYGYLEAGKNVITLFKNRGWDAIIADDLVGNVFFLLSIVTGLLMGGLGYFMATTGEVFKDIDEFDGFGKWVAFGIGILVGLIICSTFLSSVSSAVNAVIVLFAEAPSEFESNYPELSTEMRSAYISAYPGAL